MSSLHYISLDGSKIHDYFAEKYDISESSLEINRHPIFKELENYTLIDGCVNKKDSPKENNVGLGSSLSATSPLKKGNPKPLIQTQKVKKVTKFDNSVWQLLNEIQKKFIGQEAAAKGLFYNIVNNQQLAEMEDDSMDFEYNGNLLEEDRINQVANEIVNKYSQINLEKAKEAAMLEGKISDYKTIDDELNRLYNVMLVNSDNKEIVTIVYKDFLGVLKNSNIEEDRNNYVNLIDGMRVFFFLLSLNEDLPI